MQHFSIFRCTNKTAQDTDTRDFTGGCEKIKRWRCYCAQTAWSFPEQTDWGAGWGPTAMSVQSPLWIYPAVGESPRPGGPVSDPETHAADRTSRVPGPKCLYQPRVWTAGLDVCTLWKINMTYAGKFVCFYWAALKTVPYHNCVFKEVFFWRWSCQRKTQTDA